MERFVALPRLVRHRPAAVYLQGAVTFGLDLWVPQDLDISILYSLGISACGWLRSRFHLWIATTICIVCVYADLGFGAPPLARYDPWWFYLANRSFVVCTLLVLASIVHLWIGSLAALEDSRFLLTRQNEALRDSGAQLEQRVQRRTHELEMMSRRRHEAQAALHQAQKMEAIGQLTGSVAHDFNNLLTVIAGNAELLEQRGISEQDKRQAGAVLKAVERGQRLIRQLLTFARRQVLHPESLDLRERTRDVQSLIRRSLREDISVSFVIPDDLWLLKADLAELELALLNIAINARDAMPAGGTLRVEARNITFSEGGYREDDLLGDYVALTLADSGSGIDAETLSRVFEPFFTTKEAGKGTGLGLSQVYGFARQCGGTVVIRSTLGEGTSVTLYLPRDRSAARATRNGATPQPAPRRFTGHILYVEDHPEVAAVTQEILLQIGCTVRRTEDARAALAVLDETSAFDLVLTDVLMPGGLNGIELAHEIRRRFPKLPVLLTSGYSEAADDAFVLLPKPYSVDLLAEAVMNAIGSAKADGTEIS
jgi:signal transduction histidine kinase